MQPRVTAILVARNGSDYLDRTLAALTAQTRQPDAVVLVDAGSTDTTAQILASSGASQLVTSTAKRGLGGGIAQAVHVAVPGTGEDDWIWLLTHDSAPHPQALASLLGAVEIAPSVAIAGPKIMRWDRPDTIAEYGETITRLGASIALVENELDQAQYDTQSDILAVAANGMLVRRSVWGALGGFDPGLPTVDAALDFSIRARLAGHRVVGVPSARVSSAGGPELFGRPTVSASATTRLRRAAQLHRRMVYSRSILVPIHWLSLLPLAILRSAGHLIAKHPGAIAGEFATALLTAFSGAIGPARRNLKRTRRLGWSAIAPLRMSPAGARERRAGRAASSSALAADAESDYTPRLRASFLSGGGGWVVLLTAVIGIIGFAPLLGAVAAAGGALLPLSSSVVQLWSNVGYGWHDVGGGFVGASDPFAAVLAVLGTITFWSPSTSIVLFYFVALPLSALGAWWAATRLSERTWPPAIAALLWALAPPLLSSLNTGHLGAAIAHVLLPWLVVAALGASRSWAAAAGAALLFAATVASAPSLAPALVILLLGWIAFRPTAAHRLVSILIPAAALFAPLVVAQVIRGTPLAILADPGLPVAGARPSALHLALGSPDASLGGWDGSTIAGIPGFLLVLILLAPFAVLALLGAFLPGTRRSIPSLVVALLGFVTAVAATRLDLAVVGSHAASVWPGAGLSLFWLGLVGSAVVALEALGRGVVVPGLVVAVTAGLAVLPLVAAPLAGTAAVHASSGTLVPAYVSAEAAKRPRLGTLVLTPQTTGGLAASITRGEGTTLDRLNSFAATAPSQRSSSATTATLAGNLASRSGLDTAAAMRTAKIGFVLLAPARTDEESEVRQRAADALDGNRALTPIGDTAFGLLWRFAALPQAGLAADTPSGGALRPLIGVGLGIVFVVTALLAIPTRRTRRRSATRGEPDAPAKLGEDDDE